MGDLGFNQAIGQKEADVGAANRDYPDQPATSQGYPEMKMWALQA